MTLIPVGSYLDVSRKSVRPREVTLWTILTALPQPLLAVPAYMFVQVFSALFPFFAGFAAGCMIWISFAEIIPDALENISPTTLATATTTTTFGFKAMQYLLDALLSDEVSSTDLLSYVMYLLPVLFFFSLASIFFYVLRGFIVKHKGNTDVHLWICRKEKLSPAGDIYSSV